MAVAIYHEPELESMISDVDEVDEWKKTIKKLELEGQQALVQREDDAKAAPPVYMPMNNSMVNMFKVLCPKKSDYKSYGHGTIPLEVLKEIALAVHENYFDKIQIWYDDVDPDPIAVGFSGQSKQLIARWGDEVIPIEELMVKAKNRLTEGLKKQLKKMENELESSVDEFLSGRSVYQSLQFDRGDYL